MRPVTSQLMRQMWMRLERVHAIVYFEPRAKEIYSGAGLKGYWMGYFASRSAALGPVPADVVIAAFYNFKPDKVRRAIPDAWTFASPERVLEARLTVAETSLSRLTTDVKEASELAVSIAEGIDVSGRVLAAAHLATDRPRDPALSLWWAATVLREHRGDGHVAILVSEGIDGCEAHVLKHSSGEGPGPDEMELARGWTRAEWDAARQRLEERGLVAGGSLSNAGRALCDRMERRTDELASRPYLVEGSDRTERLLELLGPIAEEIDGWGDIPYPNPMGLPQIA